MSSNRNLTKSYFEMFEYARSVLKENPKCATIMWHVKDRNYGLENFFSAYVLVKYGDLDERSYNNVISEFKEKYRIELEESYNLELDRNRLWSYKDNPFYQSVLQLIEQSQSPENDTSAKFKWK